MAGVRPFGGQGRSDTGPEAGGPHHLYGFATDKAQAVNTPAAGGNAFPMAMGEWAQRGLAAF